MIGENPDPGHVVVVGAGVFGAAGALELARRGWRVTLVDRSPEPHPDASSTDISKMVRMDYGSDVFYHELAERALDGWDGWNADWPRPLFHDEGFLVLAPEPMAPGGFEHESFRVLRERGYEPERLDSASLRRRWPAWNAERYPDGYLSPRGGWAESGAVVARLLELCAAAGVQRTVGRARGLRTEGARVSGVLVGEDAPADAAGAPGPETLLEADRVVVAAGAWTPSLVPELSDVLRCVAQPVVHFGVDRPDDWRGASFPPFAADIAGSGWYGFPALADGRLKLGHHGPGREVAPDARGVVGPEHLERARAFLRGSLPALADAPVLGTRVCLYCDSVDGDLLVAADPVREGLVVASGGSGHAFKFAPLLGALVADAVEGRENACTDRFRWRTESRPAAEEARMTDPTDDPAQPPDPEARPR